MTNIKLEIKPFYAILLLFIALSLTILKPFIGTILGAIVISYVSHPLYKWLLNKLSNKTISALITTMVVVLVLTLPTVFAINALSKEIFAGYLTAKQYLNLGTAAINCNANAVCNLFELAGFKDPNFSSFLTDSLGKATAAIFNKLTAYVISLPKLLANIFVAIFLTYYLLKDGHKLVSYIKSILPIKQANQEILIKRFNDVTYAVVYGNLIVAIIQGVLTSLGFLILGVGSPLIWGIVTMFTSLIPFLGAVVVWLPAAILLIISGYTSGDGTTLLRGLGLLLYGTFVISSMDNILKPRIISYNRISLISINNARVLFFL